MFDHLPSLLLLSGLGCLQGLTAQDESPSPAAALKTKLASPFLRKADWLVDFDAARAAARQRRTLIFGYFTTAGP